MTMTELVAEGKGIVAMGQTLQTRTHRQRDDKVQYRFLDNTGRWRWGPGSARRAPYRDCMKCGSDLTFVQQEDGTVYSVCPRCGGRCAEWCPSQANEMGWDGNASWRRALKG